MAATDSALTTEDIFFTVTSAGKTIQMHMGTVGVQLMSAKKGAQQHASTIPFHDMLDVIAARNPPRIGFAMKDGSRRSFEASEEVRNRAVPVILVRMHELSEARRKERAASVRAAFDALTDSSEDDESEEEDDESEQEDDENEEERKEDQEEDSGDGITPQGTGSSSDEDDDNMSDTGAGVGLDLEPATKAIVKTAPLQLSELGKGASVSWDDHVTISLKRCRCDHVIN